MVKKKYCFYMIFSLLCFVCMAASANKTMTANAETSTTIGDLNEDVNVTYADMDLFASYLIDEETTTTEDTLLSNGDVNNDNAYDVKDLVRYALYLTEPSESLSGAGTEADPHVISNLADWYRFTEDSQASSLEGNYYKVTSDIVANNGTQASWEPSKELLREWTPIGLKSMSPGVSFTEFKGILSGEGHTISGVYQPTKGINRQYNLLGYIRECTPNINLTNSKIHYAADEMAAISVSGAVTDSTISLGISRTNVRVEGQNILQNRSGDSTKFETLCNSITVEQLGDGTHWRLKIVDDKAQLLCSDASLTARGKTTYYDTLKEAFRHANYHENSGETFVIEVLDDAIVDEVISIERDIIMRNLAGKEITVSRGTDMADNMFFMSLDNVTFQMSNNSTGSLTIDGSSTSAVAGITIFNSHPNSEFILNEGVTLQNANSTVAGAALYTAGRATLYGDVKNNHTSAAGGAIGITTVENESVAGSVTIKQGTYEGNTSDERGGAIYLGVGTTLSIEGGTFINNSAPRGGVISAPFSATVQISGGEFTGNRATGTDAGGGVLDLVNCNATITNASMTGNSSDSTARGGEAIMLAYEATVSLTNCTFNNADSTIENECDIFLTGNGNEYVQVLDASFTGIVGWLGTQGGTDSADGISRKVSFDSTNSVCLDLTRGKRFTVDYTNQTITEVIIETTTEDTDGTTTEDTNGTTTEGTT